MINKGLLQWEIIPAEEVLPGLHGRTVHSENMTAIWWNIDQDARLPQHAHPHEQIATCIAGEFELTVDGELFRMTPQTTVCIPASVLHSGRALTDCVIYDVFSPVRKDYQV